ncbi:DUF6282 family protein [Celeribacter indicus]|uniref:Amidohydrolase-related domain-containing protein n=1 Tax=Celeribacter indicus TaxID=1208324 RepID=A0A0B5DUL0_9RHOB|nr:DUF6282 family protein [Celeribacter indicus]AJE46704.1 hypothetical protein P73_1989 [Celeribacter indicus]SDX04386.1 hypothetical protein SAMN05443573_11210 [Celeribacter indicus]
MPDKDPDSRIDALMKGAVDLHIHSGPSLHPRKIDHIEALKQADEAGMRAILLKDHYYPTMPIATLLNDNMESETEVLSAIVMNHPLGGFNPSAVDYALKQGARIVWMPTAHAENHIIKTSKDLKGKFPENSKKTVEAAGLRLVGDNGAVRDDVKQILDLIAEADACVSAGHHHVDEAFPFYEEARARGVTRLFLNHPTYVNGGSMDQIRDLVGMGVMMEHSICMFIPSTFQLFDDEHLRNVIAAAGVENTFFGSDLGQNGNPTPVEGMRAIIELLLRLGYPDSDVRAMTATNAARFVGLAE